MVSLNQKLTKTKKRPRDINTQVLQVLGPISEVHQKNYNPISEIPKRKMIHV